MGKNATGFALKYKLSAELFLGMGFENQCSEGAEKDCGCDACGCTGESAGERTENADLLYGFFHAVGEGMSEAGEGDGCASTCEIHQRAINPDGAENHAEDNVPHKDARWGQLCP